MDLEWERSYPFYQINKTDLISVFREFDKTLCVLSFEKINIGCRNSNFAVNTNRGAFLLRFSPPDENGFINEKAAYQLLSDTVKMPTLYYTVKFGERMCMVYEYIHAVSLQSICIGGPRLDDDVIRQVAKNAALIHRFVKPHIGAFPRLQLPPFSTWYDYFLGNPLAAKRLGDDTVKRIRKLVQENDEQLLCIDSYHSLIHCDFRPANMLMNKNGVVYTVDWENAGEGHTLADIGQFFRYGSCFDQEHLMLFEKEYNLHASNPLPGEWYSLSRLRDLINPLQMIGSDAELPNKYEDLTNLILDTLDYFGY